MCSCFPPRLRLHDSKLAHMKAVLTLEKNSGISVGNLRQEI